MMFMVTSTTSSTHQCLSLLKAEKGVVGEESVCSQMWREGEVSRFCEETGWEMVNSKRKRREEKERGERETMASSTAIRSNHHRL